MSCAVAVELSWIIPTNPAKARIERFGKGAYIQARLRQEGISEDAARAEFTTPLVAHSSRSKTSRASLTRLER